MMAEDIQIEKISMDVVIEALNSEDEDIHDLEEIDREQTIASSRSEFAAVIFHEIPETYPADADIDCNYTLTSDIYPSTRDYIGLYKVGWMSYRDYVYYEWAPWPNQYEAGKNIDSKVLFPSRKMPTDDGEFYQFCYVMKTGQIRGASMPFQFKRPTADDFVEEEDADGDMLVIRSKTVYLEEKLKTAEDERTKLLETQSNLERERESLVAKMMGLTKQLENETESNDYLNDQLKLSHDKILQLNKEGDDMILVHDQLQTKINELTELKISVETRVLNLEKDMYVLNQNLKSLQNEKDELMGKNKSLEQEKELYKNHMTSSESVVQNHQREVDGLKTELLVCREELKVSKVEFLAVKVAFETEKSELQKQSSSTTRTQEHVEALTEALRNVEDKLATEETNKKMLGEEIGAFQITQEKMSRDLENSELEADNLRENLTRYEVQVNKIHQDNRKERDRLTVELAETVAEMTRLVGVEKELSDLQSERSRANSLEKEVQTLKEDCEKIKETSDNATASHFALQKTNTILKERLVKARRRCDDLVSQLETLKKTQENMESEMGREVKDLRERIYMCSNEYKSLFQKNRKLQKKADKVGLRSRSKVEVESLKKSSPTTGAEAKLESTDSTYADLHQNVESLSLELEEMKAKKDKYKKLYQEEKEKQEMLRKHYYDETRRAEEEMERLRRQSADMREEHALKTKSMQNLLSQKEKQIEELSRSRRHHAELQKDKERQQQSPKKEGTGMSRNYKPVYPVQLYPNPYDNEPAGDRVAVCYPPQCTIERIEYPHPTPGAMGIQYPQQTIPDSSGSSSGQNKLESVHLEIDSVSESEASGPLDPPLQPTVLPLAKVAAVRSAIHSESQYCGDFVLTLETSVEGETLEKVPVSSPITPSAPVVNTDNQDIEEDRYQDAAGEAMKICPTCNITFAHDVNERDYELHILSHFGRICPMCDAQMEMNDSAEDFEKHVNGHLTG